MDPVGQTARSDVVSTVSVLSDGKQIQGGARARECFGFPPDPPWPPVGGFFGFVVGVVSFARRGVAGRGVGGRKHFSGSPELRV